MTPMPRLELTSLPTARVLALAFTFACTALIPPSSQAQLAPSASAEPALVAASDASVPSLEELGLPSTPSQDSSQTSAKPQDQTPQKSGAHPDNGLSMQDLGFSSTQTQGSASQQALLEKRTHMLKVHQTLGLITAVPLYATVLVSGGAKQKKGPNGIREPSSANVDLHAALGSLTAGLYGATAYYAIFAPKVPGVKPKGAIKLHRDLAYIHFPGMILTPILGGMALSQENKGQKVHGIASAHSAVAATTVVAYTASIIAVSWPIHWKFWEH
jgi:hypothetical protein